MLLLQLSKIGKAKKPKAKDYRAIRAVFKKTNSKTSKKEVQKLYKKHQSMTNEDYLLLDCISRAKQIRNFINEHDLSKFNKDDINNLFQLITEINFKFSELIKN